MSNFDELHKTNLFLALLFFSPKTGAASICTYRFLFNLEVKMCPNFLKYYFQDPSFQYAAMLCPVLFEQI